MKKWSYFNKFKELNNKYLPDMGEGETKATQIVTAVTKLVYKWYNDGDVYDNTYMMKGWCNDLSSYANWLHKNCGEEVQLILEKISKCYGDSDYEDLLAELADKLMDAKELEKLNNQPKVDCIYTCKGPFEFNEYEDEEDDYEDDDYYEEDEDEGWY